MAAAAAARRAHAGEVDCPVARGAHAWREGLPPATRLETETQCIMVVTYAFDRHCSAQRAPKTFGSDLARTARLYFLNMVAARAARAHVSRES